MRRTGTLIVALLFWAGNCAAQHSSQMSDVNFRYSAQVSNTDGVNRSSFTLRGGAAEAAWSITDLRKHTTLETVADFGVEHTGAVANADYGLTLTTIAFGPRLKTSVNGKTSIFAQMLYGVALGTGSQFPQSNSFTSSASSYALSLGGGAEIALNKRWSIRAAQLDYLRTGLPNISSNWQNSLRVAGGVTLRLHP